MILLQQMMVLFIIMMIGYVCRRIGLFGPESSKLLSGIVVNVANPALILSSTINKEATIQGKELALTIGLAISFYVALLVIAEIICSLNHPLEVDNKLLTFSITKISGCNRSTKFKYSIKRKLRGSSRPNFFPFKE